MQKKFKRVEVEWEGEKLVGILLPYSSDYFILKLDSGYNVGIPKKGVKIKELEEIELKEEKPLEEKEYEIAVIGCGGTISSRVDYKTGAVVPSMNFSAFEGVRERIKPIDLFKLFSEEFTTEHWEDLAEVVYQELKEDKPVLILHGTDTMHYSSASLAFSIQSLNKPVVFTGAQRSVDRPSSDAKENVLNSIFALKQDFGEVGIIMHSSPNDDYAYLHRGVKVRKMHTSRRDAFKSINIKPLAKINHKKKEFKLIEELYPLKKPSKLGKLENHFNPNVAILYYSPSLNPKIVEKYSMFDGVVLAGTGLGHVSLGINKDSRIKPILKELEQLIESDVKVVIASQTIYGRINLNVYSTGRKLKEIGVIGDYCDYTIETAFVKLSWVLGKEKDYKRVKELMETNLVGEITDRSEFIENEG